MGLLMETMTITEAMAEIILIKKKLEKKRTTIGENLTRYEHMKDPFEESGGSSTMIREEFQSINDLEDKLVRIRTAIAKANLDTELTVEGELRSMAGWLAWRRDVADARRQHLKIASGSLAVEMKRVAERPQVTKDERSGETFLVKLIANWELKDLNAKAERVETISQRLDGLLSLKNATVMISF